MLKLGKLKANPYLYGCYQLYSRWKARQAGDCGDVPRFPLRIGIESTNVCNLKCEFCGYRYAKRKKGFISVELYEKVILQVKDMGIPRVTLHTVGEPLLHKNIVDLVRIAHENGVQVGFSSNGQFLTKELARELIKAGLDGISFSGDGGTKETFERLRKGGKFETLIENMRIMKELRDELGEVRDGFFYGKRKRPQIGIACIYTSLVEKEIDEYVRIFSPYVDYFKFVPVENQGAQNQGEEMIFPEWKGVHNPKFKFMRKPCDLYWSTLFVLWDGRVTPCCIDHDAKLVVGDVNQQHLKEIWLSEKMSELRRKHLLNKMEETADCAKCDRLHRNVYRSWFFSEDLKKKFNLKKLKN